jgi:tripartite-type tricarboxylate transporter receptor subunit TctC
MDGRILMINSMRYALALACSVGLLGLTATAQADYPTREVTIIVPPSAGGGTDLLFRALAAATEPHLGKPILIVNRPGAGGAIGTAEIARARKDGYTIGAVLQQIYLPLTRPELSYKPTDFTFITMINADPITIAVRADSPWKSLEDLIAAAKDKPGIITVGNCGNACVSHIATGLIEQKAGVKFQSVPFEGHAPGRTALLGGHVDVMMLTPSEAADLAKAGQLRVLAVADTKRNALLPDVPTVKEAIGVEVVTLAWRALGGPSGMPADVVAKLRDAFRKGIAEPKFQEFATNNGFPLLQIEGDELKAFIDREREDWRSALSGLGLLKD